MERIAMLFSSDNSKVNCSLEAALFTALYRREKRIGSILRDALLIGPPRVGIIDGGINSNFISTKSTTCWLCWESVPCIIVIGRIVKVGQIWDRAIREEPFLVMRFQLSLT